ncbi:hypothetical protein Bbelb_293630 [Branchiostoma belcheri]|nr:hypothetical protein Bbelb_293630 [Branchiostoma belcheri]
MRDWTGTTGHIWGHPSSGTVLRLQVCLTNDPGLTWSRTGHLVVSMETGRAILPVLGAGGVAVHVTDRSSVPPAGNTQTLAWVPSYLYAGAPTLASLRSTS